jgi:CRISPR-associated protein (TIGR02710 family)
MTHVLIVSLGNSPEPIINCINSLRPDRVVFFCSELSKPNISAVLDRVPLADYQEESDVVVLQQRLHRKQSEDVINELDQLDRVYTRACTLIAAVRAQHPGCSITVDYTGGTKTMTTGLAMAAIDDGRAQLSVTITDRSTQMAHASGYSVPVLVSTAVIQARRLFEQDLPALLKRFDYEAARQAVRRILQLPSQDAEMTRELRRLEDLLVVCDAWDRFDHRRALEVIERLADRNMDQRLLFPLKRVIGSRRILDRMAEAEKWSHMPGHGLEAVEDLLRNAERRAAQDRYDDAVGRLYRAMELTEQILLQKTAGIDTADVDIERLPQHLQDSYRKKQEASADDGKLKMALMNAYDLLADLEHPVGLRWREQRSRIQDCLKARNHSLFAHGFSPISYGDWKSLLDTLGPFLQQAIDEAIAQSKVKAPVLQQLPCTLAELLPRESC